ncbi:MAG: glycosyltransferase [Bacteroidetes bacterium]|nr:glycosyltransferase [Bacteroidota bacterium]
MHPPQNRRKIIVSVTNDLVTDQRVNKVCGTLQEMGFSVFLIGRKLPNSLPIPKEWTFETKRMLLLFTAGPLFYLEYNLRLFFMLLFSKSEILLANDLDTLAANYVAAKLRGFKLVYDSHELFTEVPELQNNPVKKRIWEYLERSIVPKLKYTYTVNNSIAEILEGKYNVHFHVVRNIPRRIALKNNVTRSMLELPDDKNIIILQGSGININRGAEELVEAMLFIDNALLLIIGGGDVIEKLKIKTVQLQLSQKVKFIAKQPYSELIKYTQCADLGVSLDKDTCLNYKYSLPNKIFDYIQAQTPVLTSNLIELRKVVDAYQVGTCVQTVAPKEISDAINSIFVNKQQLLIWKQNCIKAAEELCWENEQKKLIEVFEKVK